MVLCCIARVNQSRVTGVCPQIVLYCTKQRSVEPERAKSHIPQRMCVSFSNGYLIRELNGSAHGTLNMTQYFAWPCGWVANNCLALQQDFHLYLNNNNNNNNNNSSIVLTMVPPLNGTKLNQFRLGICITAPELSV